MNEENLEVFFDQGLITLELRELELVGHGMMRDPETSNLEIIQFNGPIKTGNFIIQPEEELNE